MSGQGRRAALPPGDHRAVSPLPPGGLLVSVINKAGYTRTFAFTGLPVPEPLQRSLARAFAAQSRQWTGHRSATTYWRALKVFVEFLADLEEPPNDLDELTSVMLKRWRQRCLGTPRGRSWMPLVRAVLRQDSRLEHGLVAEELARRVPQIGPSKQSLGDDERREIVLAAQREFRSAWLRIRDNAALLQDFRAGRVTAGTAQWRLAKKLDHLALTGDVPRTPSGHAANPVLMGGCTYEHTWGRLFLTRRELTSLAVLLTDRFGWNLSVYQRMPAPTALPSAAETSTVTYQVSVEKRRAGQGRWFSTENVTDSGADTDGRLITQALQATAPGRALAARLAPGTDLLMAARAHRPPQELADKDAPQPVGPLVFGVTTDNAKHWAKHHGTKGLPFQRLRRTAVTREGRPLQHSRGTHESVYVLPDHHVQRESRHAFADGALEAVKQARATVFLGRLTDAASPAHQETATADCANEASSPWPSGDGTCAADFLLCLACPNAHVHPGHHPRLAHLHRQIGSLRSVLPGPAWSEQWSPHFLRLEDLRTKVGPGAWTAALAQVVEPDRAIVDSLVKGELAP